jgi:hypothetical protein
LGRALRFDGDLAEGGTSVVEDARKSGELGVSIRHPDKGALDAAAEDGGVTSPIKQAQGHAVLSQHLHSSISCRSKHGSDGTLSRPLIGQAPYRDLTASWLDEALLLLNQQRHSVAADEEGVEGLVSSLLPGCTASIIITEPDVVTVAGRARLATN